MPEQKIDIMRMPPELIVDLIQKSGCKAFTRELLDADIAKGAPVNEDGTINMFDYGAWLYDGGYNG